MATDDQIYTEVKRLATRVEKMEELLQQIHREIGAREGRPLSQQVDEIYADVDVVRSEITKVLLDTTNMRKTQEFGSRDISEIKKALAAIYRQVDEIEKFIVPTGLRETI